MLTFVTIIHLLVCIFLAIVILMQSSKGGGLAGAFGGQGSMGAVFGGRGAGNFLSKTTIVLATIFMLGSIAQGLIKKDSGMGESLIQQEAQRQEIRPSDLLPGIQSPQDMSTQAGSQTQTNEKSTSDTTQ